jgi:hypothetical protein
LTAYSEFVWNAEAWFRFHTVKHASQRESCDKSQHSKMPIFPNLNDQVSYKAESFSLKLLPPKGGTPTFLPIFRTFDTALLGIGSSHNSDEEFCLFIFC